MKEPETMPVDQHAVASEVATASSDLASPNYPNVGELWDCLGRTAFIAGNSVGSNGGIWLFDWNSGDSGHFSVMDLTARSDRFRLTEEDILLHIAPWSRQGNSDAMWWLGWWYDGRNHPKSVWYYVAAIRAAPKKHGWALGRIISDARSAYMCEGVPAPDLAFVADVDEMQGRCSADWAGAVRQAEAAVHIPSAEQFSRRVFKARTLAPAAPTNPAIN